MGIATGLPAARLSKPSGRARPDMRRPTSPGQLGALAARILAAACLGTLMLAGHSNGLALTLLVVIVVLALDTSNPLGLKNFVLIYIVMVFAVGGAVLHLTTRPIYSDIVAYILAFLAAYAVATLPSRREHQDHDGLRHPAGKGPLSIFAIEHALLALIGLNLLFLAFQFLKYGVVGYYQGQGLLNQALTYGQASTTGGAEQIVRFALSDGGLALVILYVRACFESWSPIRYRYPAVLFVALPIMSLARFNAVNGALTVLAIYACDRRLTAQRRTVGASKRAGPAKAADVSEAFAASAPVAPHVVPARVNRVALILLGIALAIATAALVASIRGGFTNKTGGVGKAPDTVAMFSSELTPVQAYGDIQANIAILGHTHGRTIIWPLLLKVVPRAWYPNKPLNSGAYYMSKLRPLEWAAGYALPPTLFGDAYLSFGFGGALAAAVLLGVLVARLDIGYRQAILSRLPWFLLIFANLFALMRDPVSESLAGIALTMLVWAVGNRVFRPGQSVPVDRGNLRSKPGNNGKSRPQGDVVHRRGQRPALR